MLATRKNPIEEISRCITGISYQDPAMIGRILEDKRIVKAKYGLPPTHLLISDPVEYLRKLEAIAARHKIPIIRRDLFDPEDASRRSIFEICYTGDGLVYLPASENFHQGNGKKTRQMHPGDEAMLLEHELTHGLQHLFARSMPIEGKEYEAYLSLPGLTRTHLSNEFNVRMFFDDIAASSRVFYKQKGIDQAHWDIPPIKI